MKFLHQLLLAIALLLAPSLASATQPITLRWIVAHGPKDEAVIKSMAKFSARVFERTNGKVKIDSVNAYPEWNQRVVTSGAGAKALRAVIKGEADFSQVSTFFLTAYDPVYEIFDLPFLFRDYSHLENTITGVTGQDLLKKVGISSKGKLLAMDFTYCGGYRVLYGSKPIAAMEDFSKMRMEMIPNFVLSDLVATSRPGRTVRADFFQSLGVKFESGRNQGEIGTDLYDQGSIDLLEAPYKEILWNSEILKKKISYLIEMKHSVVTTTIVANGARFAALPVDLQKILKEEIHEMAKMERQLFVESNSASKQELMKAGAKLIELDANEQRKMREKAQPIFEKFNRAAKVNVMGLVNAK